MINKYVKKQLVEIVGKERYADDDETLIGYSYDGYVVESLPDAVVFPLETEEVSAIVKIAAEHRIPIVARGGGSNLSGGTVPVKGGAYPQFD